MVLPYFYFCIYVCYIFNPYYCVLINMMHTLSKRKCGSAATLKGVMLMNTIHLKEYEKKYLKHLILLSIVDVIVIKLCLLFKIRIPIKKPLFDNLALLWIIDMFLWFALLNAFSSKKCRYKPYPFWYYLITILNLILFTILVIRN